MWPRRTPAIPRRRSRIKLGGLAFDQRFMTGWRSPAHNKSPFFHVLAIMLRRMALRSSRILWFLVCAAVLSFFVLPGTVNSQTVAPTPAPAPGFSNVVELRIDGEIEPILAD